VARAAAYLFLFFLAEQKEDAMTAISEDGEREFKQWEERFVFEIEDCKRYFGQWDECDPVSWAILRVVQAQNDFSHAMELYACYDVNFRVIEEAIAERIKAIAALQQAIEKQPRGFL
jgi:hypothetical protein